MGTISTTKRNALEASQFALPDKRKFPIHDAAHTRNAAARLEQAKKDGKISGADYAKAKSAIARAAKRFGIHSELNASPKGRKLHVRAELGDGGSLHVRHMNDRVIALDGVPVLLADDDKKPVWIELAKPGVFKGHPAGPFELNDRVFAEIIRNFKATQNRAVPIDFEHASESSPTDGSIPVVGAPAQGWIKDLKVDGGRLCGLVEWGDRAREYIRSGQYKFFSPAIRFGARDRVTGEQIGARLTSGALTNEPFLDGLRPLVAKDERGGDGAVVAMRAGLAHSPDEYMPRIRSALRMSDLSTARECSDQLGRLRDHLDAVDGDHEATHEGIALKNYLMPMRDLVGAQPGATWEDILDVVQDLIDAAMDRHEVLDHGGLDPEAGETAGMTDDPNDSTAVRMHDEENENMELTTKITELSTQLAETKATLSDRESKVLAAEAKLRDTEAKVAELTLSLKETNTRAATAETELKSLRDWKASREEQDLSDRVTEAFETYKDAHKLTDADKETMLIVLKAKPEAFEKKYPKVQPDKRHLMRTLTEARELPPATTHIDEGAAPGVRVDTAALARQLSAQRGIPLADAQRIVLLSMQKPKK